MRHVPVRVPGFRRNHDGSRRDPRKAHAAGKPGSPPHRGSRSGQRKAQSLPPVRLLSGELPFRRFHSGNFHGGPRHCRVLQRPFAPQESHLPHPAAEPEAVRLPAEDQRPVPGPRHARGQQPAGYRHVFPAAAPVPRRTPHAAPRQAAPERQDRRGEYSRREKPPQGGLLPRLHGRQDLHQCFRSLPQGVRLPRSRRLSAYQLFLLRHPRPLVRRP